MRKRCRARDWLKLITSAAILFGAVAGGSIAASPSSQAVERAQEAASSVQSFRSRPDLRPPAVRVLTPAKGTAPGYLLVAEHHGPGQHGPMILDDRGQLVFFQPLRGQVATDLRAQTYLGRPVLTWWQGGISQGGHGCGVGVIVNSSYHRVATVRGRARGAHCLDLHEFLLTPHGAVLVIEYVPVRHRGRMVLDSVIQRLDVKTGRVLFSWSALRHVPLSRSYVKPPRSKRTPWDAYHANSIDFDRNGNLLLSFRHTWAVYKVSQRTGRVTWTLGGKRSALSIPRGARFGWQHDARFQPGGGVTLFDNSGAEDSRLHRTSRGLAFRLDFTRRKAVPLTGYHLPKPGVLARSQGNLQRLPGGNVFVGWGAQPYFSEFSQDGKLLFDARLPRKAMSYRAYRSPWFSRPSSAPALALRQVGRQVRAYASWNGSTELAGWRILVGASPGALGVATTVARSGFETATTLPAGARYAAVAALDASGHVLRTSKTLRVPGS